MTRRIGQTGQLNAQSCSSGVDNPGSHERGECCRYRLLKNHGPNLWEVEMLDEPGRTMRLRFVGRQQWDRYF